jgi:HEAT repeat protein
MRSQVTSLDSVEVKKVLQAFNEIHHLRSLDTIQREQIENLTQTINLYEISLETCEIQADNYELLIKSTEAELGETKKALNKSEQRYKFMKGATPVLVVAAFVAGLLI